MMFQRQLTSRFGWMAGACLLLGGLAGACSASNDINMFGGDGNGGNSSGAQGSAGNDPSDPPDDFTTSGTGTGTGTGLGDGCAKSETKAEQVPLDMYIMLDTSGSMVLPDTTKWDQITEALGTFLQQPSAAGISVGIQYFPNATASCDATKYAKPAVEIAPLPGAASAIITSIGNQTPSGGTPTSAALTGAIQHAKAWAIAHPTHVTIAVFATDGEPQGCNESLSFINGIAAAGAKGTPKILTYVIGVGDLVTTLNGIAAAGGTKKAFIVDPTQDTGQKFLEAMNQIRGAALACSYLIPVPVSGETPDFGSVNVQYTPGATGSTPVIFPKVQDKAQCEAGVDAWYYDDNAAPTQIILCDSTCTSLSADTAGQVKVVLGCGTVVK
jgi:hypothetical protein